MRTKTWYAACIVCILACTTVSAERIHIGLMQNSNPLDVDAISAECETAPGGEQMTCNFVQVRVDLVKKPEEAGIALEKQLQETTPEEIARVCSDKQRKDMADLATKGATAQSYGPRQKAFLTGFVQRLNAVCDKPTTKNIRNFLWYNLQRDTKTCRVWTNPWKETFTKQLGNKWVSKEGPSGICGVVVVSTLESKPLDSKNPDTMSSLWTYETQKIVTNKEMGGDFCQLDESKGRYSWNTKEIDRGCEFIEFRLPF